MSAAKRFSLAIHGGAGVLTRSKMNEEREKSYRSSLRDALIAGQVVLEQNGSALDAAVASVVSLENNPLFNAGKGSVFNTAGFIEMEASVMDGATLQCGTVSGIRRVKNPILLARKVMESTEHIFLYGESAEDLAKKHNLDFENEHYFETEHRRSQLQSALKKSKTFLDHSNPNEQGTVGAVAFDRKGNLATATSTGGLTNKLVGRIGDTPIIGAGSYANNHTCAVSCTGRGETFMRDVTAFRMSCLMDYKQLTLKDACYESVLNPETRKISGGLIAVDKDGNVELPFNSEGMLRGWTREGESLNVAIYGDE